MGGTPAELAAAREARDREDWVAAQAFYEAVIAERPGGDAYEGLATAHLWQNHVADAFRAMEQAYALFRREGAAGRAAWAALWLAGQYMRVKGNPAAARGWAARCDRLLAEADPCAETGRVLLIRALASNDWRQVQQAAEQAIEIARRFGDTDYEALAVAYSGLALLSGGRLGEGLARLDEAMASASGGEVHAPEAIGQIYCALLSGCERTLDLQRAEQWSRVAQPFLHAYHQTGASSSCRAIYAGLLAAAGRWSDAERELVLALEGFDAGAPAMRADALVRLADLRILQGRLDEAAGLLEGNEGHPDAQPALAALELARDRPEVAAAILQRRINQLDASNPQAAPLLLRLVEAHVAAGDAVAARAAATALAALAGAGDSTRGMAQFASGRATAVEGGDPVAELEAALGSLLSAEMVFEATQARLAIADALAGSNPAFAIREARTAMARFAAMGAQPGADRAAGLLRRLGVRPAGGGRSSATLSRREEGVARLVGLGLTNDQIAARLFLSPRTVEHHVSSILRKLPASNRVEIAAYAARLAPEPTSA